MKTRNCGTTLKEELHFGKGQGDGSIIQLMKNYHQVYLICLLFHNGMGQQIRLPYHWQKLGNPQLPFVFNYNSN